MDYELMDAYANGNLEKVKYLLDRDEHKAITSTTMLVWAIDRDYLDMVKLLVQYVDIHNWFLRDACIQGRLEIVKCLIKSGADIHNERALAYAASYGHLDIVQFLVEEYKTDVNDPSVLIEACVHGHLEIVKYLVNCGADIRANNRALQQASMNGQLKIVKFLVKCGANIHDYVLLLASTRGHYNIAYFLIEHGANRSLVRDKECLAYITIQDTIRNRSARVIQKWWRLRY